MKIGAQLAAHWLADMGVLREVSQSLDEAGFDHATIGGHVLSAASGRYPDAPDERYAVPYRDPFVVFADLAARTSRLKFRTSVLILPLYPTVLVARQGADLSIASGGRFELGVGISWQQAEYEALGASFGDRGRRLEEQLELLRRFWTEPLVSFEGRYHRVDELGLSQLPPPIPIHVGTGPANERLLDRAARLADGWMPMLPEPKPESVELLHERIRAAGRDPGAFEVTGRINAAPGDEEGWAEQARRMVDAGSTQLTIAGPGDIEPQAGLSLLLAAADVAREAVATPS